MEIEVFNAKDLKSLGKCKVNKTASVMDLRQEIYSTLKGVPTPHRQSLRLQPLGKSLKDSDTLQELIVDNDGKIFVKDLGPQIGWKTVFLSEYAGPILVYTFFILNPSLIYGTTDEKTSLSLTARIAAACFIFHYVKRLLETIFVHRFSHETMPFFNLIKNCSYYWGFTAYLSYHINHPQYTSPEMQQVMFSLMAFIFCELGNFSIHLSLRNLRPAGTKIRKIPVAGRNPFTKLFHLVSCPNYTYEIGAWISFGIMTSCLPALLFALAGAYQMTVWALAKHRNYRKEFKNYPNGRRAIFPFML